ncbi:MAG: family 1 glycosylhydrolase, partial [Polyangia bacterium]
YEYDPAGLSPILKDFGTRWPDLPLLVTEGGIATDTGARRSANIVRSLEQIERARAAGVDVRGYYHWSLYDNFEWAQGFEPHFGLYSVDRSTFDRSPTSAVDIFARIASSRTLTAEQRRTFGGTGPMPAEPNVEANPALCNAMSLGR